MNTFTKNNGKKTESIENKSMDRFVNTEKIANPIRFGIPSKGRMGNETIDFLRKCGLTIKRNKREYLALIDEFPDVQLVFQRQEDIVKGVGNGLLSFGIAGFDLISEINQYSNNIAVIENKLGFGKCNLEIAIPEEWTINCISELDIDVEYRVASKFPKLTQTFLDQYQLKYKIIEGAGTLEVSPALGNSDFIVDLVSTGQTLADNRLKRIKNGCILNSEASFIGNLERLKDPRLLNFAKMFLEYFYAALRAHSYVSINANIRGIPEKVIKELFQKNNLQGMEGPTVSQIYRKDLSEWFAINIIVNKKSLSQTISDIRDIGGSGIIVTPVMYIFEDEPEPYKKLVANLQKLNTMEVLV